MTPDPRPAPPPSEDAGEAGDDFPEWRDELL